MQADVMTQVVRVTVYPSGNTGRIDIMYFLAYDMPVSDLTSTRSVVHVTRDNREHALALTCRVLNSGPEVRVTPICRGSFEVTSKGIRWALSQSGGAVVCQKDQA